MYESITPDPNIDKHTKGRMPTHCARVDLPSRQGVELCRAHRLLQAQADACLGDVNFDDFEGVALANLDGISHLRDPRLCQLRDVHQRIFADTDIDESSDGSCALDGASHIAADAECSQGGTIDFGAIPYWAGWLRWG